MFYDIKSDTAAVVMEKLFQGAVMYKAGREEIKTALETKAASDEDYFRIASPWGYIIVNFPDFLDEMFAIGCSSKDMLPTATGLFKEVKDIKKFLEKYQDTKKNNIKRIIGNITLEEIISIKEPGHHIHKEIHDLACYKVMKIIQGKTGGKKISIKSELFKNILTHGTPKSSIQDWRRMARSNTRFTVQQTTIYEAFQRKNNLVIDVILEAIQQDWKPVMDLVLKAQDGGKRHFDVPDIKTKIIQKMVEKANAIAADCLDTEMISRGSESRAKWMSDVVTSAYSDSEFLNSLQHLHTIDCTKWAPLSYMLEYYYMIIILQKVFDPITVELMIYCYLKWYLEKHVIVPNAVRYTFADNGEVFELFL